MTQANPIISSGKTGTAYRGEDNDGKQALLNHHKGSSSPSYAEAGVLWLDDSATPWLLKIYDGADWIVMAAVNAITNAVTPYSGALALGLVNYAVDTGVVNAYVVAPVPAISSYSVGQMVVLKPASTNTGASTVAVSGLSATSIKMPDGSALASGVMLSSGVYVLVHNGTDFTLVNPSRVPASSLPVGSVVDSVMSSTAAVTSISSNIPYDDTVPQNTEGTEVLSVTITPKSASNILRIRFVGQAGTSVNNEQAIGALFRDSAASALAAAYSVTTQGITQMENINILHEVVAGSASPTTFKIRLGADTSILTLNGIIGARKFGGVMRSTLLVEEIKG